MNNYYFIIPITLPPKLWKSRAILLLGIALFNMFSLSAQTPRKDSGANGSAVIKPLKIGDTIPQSLWNVPLEVVNHSAGKKTITLKDYRDKKLIILDFWATWCSSCIASFPSLYQLEDDLNNQVKVLSVTYQDRSTIEKFISKSAFMQSQNLLKSFSSVVNDNLLTTYFEKDAIPFNVVIDQRGVVRALTVPSELTKVRIAQIINDAIASPIASKLLKVKKPLLNVATDPNQKTSYYTTLMPFNPVIPTPVIKRIDSLGGYRQLLYPNMGVINLYAFSIQHKSQNKTVLSTFPSRCILEVNDADQVMGMLDDRGLNFWKYSYEAVTPLETPEPSIFQKMEDDLNYYLGMKASYQKRMMPCLVLKIADQQLLPVNKSDISYSQSIINGVATGDGTSDGRYGQKIAQENKAPKNLLKNYTVKGFVYAFNQGLKLGLPFLIDETDFKGKLDITLPDQLNNLDDFQKTLAQQGFSLILEKREMDVFVLTSQHFRQPDTEMKLTQWGYMYPQGKEHKK